MDHLQQDENAIKEENESDQEQPGEDEEEDNFDFGRAKMDFFKKRAREILTNESELEYEGVPMPV